jgi:hypothetical protein
LRNERTNPFDIVLDLGEGKQAKKIIFDQPEVELTNAIKEELKTFYESIANDTTPIVSISKLKTDELFKKLMQIIEE